MERQRGVTCPYEVAGHDDVGLGPSEDLRGSLRLGPADVVERGVELALDPPGGVVGGAAVAEQDEPAAQDVFRPAARSASRSVNAMVGQSFQRRSRA